MNYKAETFKLYIDIHLCDLDLYLVKPRTTNRFIAQGNHMTIISISK